MEAALLLADDETLHRLNRQFRGLDRPTDVLSFPQLDGPSQLPPAPIGCPLHLGDVALSVERAHRQAEASGHSFERELGYLLV
ncbi:MAG: rRNA maturation RNase YbeY, partial [Chloroflexota bacterium]